MKSSRRRRIVDITSRVVFGPMDRVKPVLAACGWQLNTAVVERLPLDIRPRVAAVGRRVNTGCQGEGGVQSHRVVGQTDHNVGLPHARLRQPWRIPEPTHGRGSAKVWQPCPPAMAAGRTAHVWSWRDVLLVRVPPWPQPQIVSEPMLVEDRGVARLKCAQL